MKNIDVNIHLSVKWIVFLILGIGLIAGVAMFGAGHSSGLPVKLEQQSTLLNSIQPITNTSSKR